MWNYPLSDSFECCLGVRQCDGLSPFLFAVFVNNFENIFVVNGVEGIGVNMFKMFLILYADDIVIFANTSNELQTSLNLLYDYCQRWKLGVCPGKVGRFSNSHKLRLLRSPLTVPSELF